MIPKTNNMYKHDVKEIRFTNVIYSYDTPGGIWSDKLINQVISAETPSSFSTVSSV